MNVVVVAGRLSRPAELRTLPSGDRLVVLDVTVPRPGERSDTVPVAWPGAPARAVTLDTGEEIVVVGRVRRRFFQAAGRTGSRTEVVADAVVPVRQRARAATAVDTALGKMADWAEAASAGQKG